jgi:predicted small lipoprotein YifL
MHCWARYLLIGAVLVLGVGQMIAACGQKGDLYLPEQEETGAEAGSAPTEVPPPSAPAEGQ